MYFIYKPVIFAYMKRTLVTITEFAKMNDVSRDTIYKWMQSDRLPNKTFVKKVAGRNFISVPEYLITESEPKKLLPF